MTDPTSAKPTAPKPAASTLAFEKGAPPRVPAPRPASTVAIEKQKPVALEGDTIASVAPLEVVREPLESDPSQLGLGATMAVESDPALSAPAHRYGDDALAATQAVDGAASSAGVRSMNGATAIATSRAGRTTVLPRVIVSDGPPQWGVDNRPRYETLKTIGEGGMGEVALVQDHDIDRQVALKKLRTEVQGTTALLRFAEEIKVIGQLEHPNIIPIHDVGIDEQGQHYFVMKYVNGETLENIIEKLRAGDPDYVKRFPHEARAQVFVAILQAVRYAHAKGIIHRDIKPANIMVGPYGEVTVMDWGLAKKIRNDDGSRLADNSERPAGIEGNPAVSMSTDRKKLIETQHGALLGTPLYMSPEQAAGKIAQLDERSDIYSLGVMFHEFLTLEHYLADRQSIGDVITAIVDTEPVPSAHFMKVAGKGVPAELNWFLQRVIEKDPAKRFQSIDEMVARLEGISNGEIVAQCGVTRFKRWNRLALKWVDRNQLLFLAMLFSSAFVLLFGLVAAIVALVRAFA